MGLFDSIGKIVSNVGSGIGSFVDTASSFAAKLNPLSQIATGISGLFDSKDSGNISRSPTFALDTNPTQYQPPPVIESTTNTGAANFTDFMIPNFGNNQGSGGSLIPMPPYGNQNSIIETSNSSIFDQIPLQTNFLGLGSKALQLARPFFPKFGLGQNLKGLDIPDIGDIVTPDDNTTFTTDYSISKLTGDFMAYGVGGQGALTIPQTMPMQGSAFMSPVLGRIGISSKGNIIITRKLRNQFKALADNVGLAQASNLAGLPLEIGAMILTKRFPVRGKSISTKKMRDCARTYRQITNFYNMIPKRTATRKASTRTMRGASTVIQNS
jgi:hypothetical protein